MSVPSLLAVFFEFPSHTGTENLQMALRWVHFLAGVTWIGLLYFFNLVNVPFMKTVTDAGMKQHVFKNLTLPALWWFRWGAVVTVFAGFWYWAHTIVPADARNSATTGGPEVSPWPAIGIFVVLWTVVWAIEYVIVLKAPGIAALNKGAVYALVVAILMIAAGYLYVELTDADWVSNRMLSIGLGGGLGWLMMLNVWGIIWRNNKAIINGALGGTPPANGPALARQAFLASRTNAFLSIPMLFFMASASHYAVK